MVATGVSIITALYLGPATPIPAICSASGRSGPRHRQMVALAWRKSFPAPARDHWLLAGLSRARPLGERCAGWNEGSGPERDADFCVSKPHQPQPNSPASTNQPVGSSRVETGSQRIGMLARRVRWPTA